MFHSTSGKVGYQYHHQPLPGYHIPRYLMKKILIHEDKLRASPEVQALYSQSDDLAWIRDVTLQVQNRALAEYGFTDARGLIALNNARLEYIDDPEMNQLTVYQRLDNSRQGKLFDGVVLPNVQLATLDGSQVMLYDYLDALRVKQNHLGAAPGGSGNDFPPAKRPILVTAGSIS